MATRDIWQRLLHGAALQSFTYIAELKISTLNVSIIFSPQLCELQPIPPGVTFSHAVSTLKAQSSNASFATFQWNWTFEL
mmetsp:Transcript_77459/g.125644  ORF Transcript_77459/g.125644 Transcript_77459/m.125644 type:complete len:80 (+) Transcript_77459:247-486(+)